MSLFDLLEKIVAVEGEVVKLKIPEERINLLSLKILKEEAERREKKLKLKPSGPKGKRLINALEEGIEPEPIVIKGRLKVPRLRLDSTSLRRVGISALLLFGILLIGGGGSYWLLNFFPRAEVVLSLKPIPMVKELSLSADVDAEEIDAQENTIPGTKASVEVEGEKSTPATGSTTVGEKAKGTVTFDNCTDEIKTFTANSLLKVEGTNLTYKVDSDVTDVPKKTGSLCGTKTGSIIATEIGEQYNKGEGAEFDFLSGLNDPYYNVYIDTDQAVAGGSSEEVTVVSAADQDKLLKELKEELLEEGKSQLGQEAGLDQVVIQKAVKQQVVEETFPQEVGEEAEEAGLTLKMKFTIITYSQEDLNDYIAQVLGERVPENYDLFPGEMEIETLNPKLSKNTLEFSAKVTAQVIPKLDLEGIKADLAGRNLSGAQDYLSSLSNITSYEVRLYPNLPESLRRIPRNTERIRIELQTETEEEL